MKTELSHSNPRHHRVLIMAGGTGGHVYPALAVAKALRERGFEVAWLGNERGFEFAKVSQAGFRFLGIEVRGLRGRSLKETLTAPVMLAKALCQTWRHFRAFKPDLVVGFGGYVSGPGGLVAAITRTPLFIHEQNAIFGLTNRVLARFAKQVMLGYPLSQNVPNSVVVGNPVRQEIAAIAPPAKRFESRTGKLKLLILGGSQGARALNETLPKALALLSKDECPEVVHQVGGGNSLATVQSAYDAAGIAAQVLPFIDDMAKVYAEADLVLARSGALTVAEIASVGLGAIFVPFPQAVDDHQTKNAQTLAQIGAATIIPQSALSAEHLADVLRQMLSRATLLQQANLAREHSQAQALNKILTLLEQS